jgi:hypothetical protein
MNPRVRVRAGVFRSGSRTCQFGNLASIALRRLLSASSRTRSRAFRRTFSFRSPAISARLNSRVEGTSIVLGKSGRTRRARRAFRRGEIEVFFSVSPKVEGDASGSTSGRSCAVTVTSSGNRGAPIGMVSRSALDAVEVSISGACGAAAIASLSMGACSCNDSSSTWRAIALRSVSPQIDLGLATLFARARDLYSTTKLRF